MSENIKPTQSRRLWIEQGKNFLDDYAAIDNFQVQYSLLWCYHSFWNLLSTEQKATLGILLEVYNLHWYRLSDFHPFVSIT